MTIGDKIKIQRKRLGLTQTLYVRVRILHPLPKRKPPKSFICKGFSGFLFLIIS